MEPRYSVPVQWAHRVVFLGQIGPVDLWWDKKDHELPYLVIWDGGLSDPKYDWSRDVPTIMRAMRYYDLHLTLHDQCRLYQLTENNGVSERPNQGDDKDEHAQC